ncbi:MAG: hypothetical protein V1902_01395 [Candidatus Falkowbacteria bacterium]
MVLSKGGGRMADRNEGAMEIQSVGGPNLETLMMRFLTRKPLTMTLETESDEWRHSRKRKFLFILTAIERWLPEGESTYPKPEIMMDKQSRMAENIKLDLLDAEWTNWELKGYLILCDERLDLMKSCYKATYLLHVPWYPVSFHYGTTTRRGFFNTEIVSLLADLFAETDRERQERESLEQKEQTKQQPMNNSVQGAGI